MTEYVSFLCFYFTLLSHRYSIRIAIHTFACYCIDIGADLFFAGIGKVAFDGDTL